MTHSRLPWIGLLLFALVCFRAGRIALRETALLPRILIAFGAGMSGMMCAYFAAGNLLLFSSYRHDCDGRKFELYLVNLDGTNLRQVTNFGSFTSFPEFSPDGRKLAFVSDWKASARYEFNVLTADWNKAGKE